MVRAMRAAPIALSLLVLACAEDLDEGAFQRKAEQIYAEANPGFGIMRRQGTNSTFVRGDQVYVLDSGPLFAAYRASKQSASKFLDAWRAKITAEAEARRRPIDEAAGAVIPIIKSGNWIRVQDLGAIGPKRVQEKIRPWRKEIAKDVFVLLGVREELLGYRYASLEEVAASKTGEDEWLAKAVANLVGMVGTSTGTELTGGDGRLLVSDILEVDGVSALILDRGFRARMLERFGTTELGAAVPNRDVLIVFDASEFVTVKPIRARTHQLYDVRNHPGYRGLLRFDRDQITILEPAAEKK